MFPQLFHRFLAARNPRTLKTTVTLYPLITTLLFFLTVSIGVLGRYTFPDLSARESESIYPLLLGRFAGPVLSTVLLTGGLAALMSTLDSQLLTLSSMLTLDFGGRLLRTVPTQKLAVVLVGALGFLLALRPPQTILDFINRTSFTGLAVLAPTVVGGLYWKKANSYGALASILAGEALVVLSFLGIVKTPGVLPVVPVLAVTVAVFVAVSLLAQRQAAAVAASPAIAGPAVPPRPEATQGLALVTPLRRPAGRTWLPWLVFAAFFILGNDYWAWGRRPVLLAGLPLWVWYYVLLGVLLSVAYAVFLRVADDDS
jgi:SSS family solute:Na+ symporter